jgi:hypothetical protein
MMVEPTRLTVPTTMRMTPIVESRNSCAWLVTAQYMMAPVVTAMMLKTIPVRPIDVSCIYSPRQVLTKIIHYSNRLGSGGETGSLVPKPAPSRVTGPRRPRPGHEIEWESVRAGLGSTPARDSHLYRMGAAPRTMTGMDRAETVRLARRMQIHARRQYEEARDKESSAEQPPEQWAQHVKELQEAAEAADAEMARLRPERPRPIDDTGEGYAPPITSEWSN